MLILQRHAAAINYSETVKFRTLQTQFCMDKIQGGASIPEDNMCQLVGQVGPSSASTWPDLLAMLTVMPLLAFMSFRPGLAFQTCPCLIDLALPYRHAFQTWPCLIAILAEVLTVAWWSDFHPGMGHTVV